LLNGGLDKDKIPEMTTVTVTEIPTLLNGFLDKDKTPEMTTVTVTVTGHNGGPTDKIPEMDRTDRHRSELRVAVPQETRVRVADGSTFKMVHLALPAATAVAPNSEAAAQAQPEEAEAEAPVEEAEAEAPVVEAVAPNSEAAAQAVPLEETEIAIHGAAPANPETPSLETHKCRSLLKSDSNELYQ